MLSGEDATALSFNVNGGVGCISVTSNIAPRLCAELQDSWFSGDIQKAMEISNKLYPLHVSMFVETSPAPVKYAASVLGICENSVRLPLVEATDAAKARIKLEVERLALKYAKSYAAQKKLQDA